MKLNPNIYTNLL